jgi:hypothetical protein
MNDIQLLELYNKNGGKWAKISKIVGDRTEHQVKNRFNQLMRLQKKRMGSINL